MLDALAAYRLTRLVTADEFPPIKAVRDAVVAWGTQDGKVGLDRHGHPHGHPLAELVVCRWCAGFWVSVFVVGARRVCPDVWDPVANALAFSAGAALISRLETD